MNKSVDEIITSGRFKGYNVTVFSEIPLLDIEEIYNLASRYNIGFIIDLEKKIATPFVIYSVFSYKKISEIQSILSKYSKYIKVIKNLSFEKFLEYLKNKRKGSILPKEVI